MRFALARPGGSQGSLPETGCRPLGMRMVRRSGAVATLMGLLLLMTIVAPVAAHAEYVTSSPQPYDIWNSPPTEVTITVSEAVQRGSQSIIVTDAHGRLVSDGPIVLSPTDPATFHVALTKISGGVYTVIWSVISADDGHFTTGYFYFMVRNPDGTAAGTFPGSPPPGFGQGPSTPPLPPDQVVLRALLFITYAVAFGAVVFLLFILRPASRDLPEEEVAASRAGYRAIHRLARLASIAFLAAVVASWADAVLGTSISGIADLVSSPYRLSLALRVPLAAGMVVLLWKPPFPEDRGRVDAQDPRPLVIAGLLAVAALLAEAATSHGALLPDWGPVGDIADAMHLYGVSIWVGGLVALLVSWPSIRPRGSPLFGRAVLGAFSRTALLALALVVLGGIILAVLLVGSLYALLILPYGWIVLLKSALLAPMVWLGFRNRGRVRPQVRPEEGPVTPGKKFVREVRAEAVLGATILVAAAFLTLMSPPTTPGTSQQLTETATAQGYFAMLQVYPYPSAPGSYLYSMLMWDAANGSPYVNLGSANASLTFMRDGGPATVAYLLGPHGANHWYVQSDAASQPGNWRIVASFVRPDGSRLDFTFTMQTYTAWSLPFLLPPPRG